VLAQVGSLGKLDLGSAELAIRTTMLNVGGSFLEKLLAVDRGYRGPLVDCEKGHQAKFVSYRDKGLDTVLGRVRLERAYYHCKECSQGVIPLDQDLDCEGLSLSPATSCQVV